MNPLQAVATLLALAAVVGEASAADNKASNAAESRAMSTADAVAAVQPLYGLTTTLGGDWYTRVGASTVSEGFEKVRAALAVLKTADGAAAASRAGITAAQIEGLTRSLADYDASRRAPSKSQ